MLFILCSIHTWGPWCACYFFSITFCYLSKPFCGCPCKILLWTSMHFVAFERLCDIRCRMMREMSRTRKKCFSERGAPQPPPPVRPNTLHTCKYPGLRFNLTSSGYVSPLDSSTVFGLQYDFRRVTDPRPLRSAGYP